jgi:hypothetical protein
MTQVDPVDQRCGGMSAVTYNSGHIGAQQQTDGDVPSMAR